MLYLKKANFADWEQEFDFISAFPAEERGFTNPHHGVTKEEFLYRVLPRFREMEQGINLPEGYVPDSKWFLWLDDAIIGMFNFRHYLNDGLRQGAGHIGYGIRREFRGRGYATEGLRLMIEKAWQIIPEEEIYLSVDKDNPASLQVQLKNGAYIHHEDEKEYYTRIPKRK